MGEVFLIRHGETEWNREAMFRGRTDISLSERGLEQATLLSYQMAGGRVEAVYSSPLSRARETAEVVAKALGFGVTVDDRLVDMSFGEWEGKTGQEAEERWPDLYRLWNEEPSACRPPGGESLEEVLARAWPAMEEIAARHGSGRAAVVSHRVVCKLLVCGALGVGVGGFWRVRVDTASVSLLEHGERGWQVKRLNDTCHLDGLGAGEQRDF